MGRRLFDKFFRVGDRNVGRGQTGESKSERVLREGISGNYAEEKTTQRGDNPRTKGKNGGNGQRVLAEIRRKQEAPATEI